MSASRYTTFGCAWVQYPLAASSRATATQGMATAVRRAARQADARGGHVELAVREDRLRQVDDADALERLALGLVDEALMP